MIEDDYVYGWWNIGNGKIDISLYNPY